jgi:hypothetical protein
MRVGYHNHDIEFRSVEGVLPWAVLYKHTCPEVILQLDTGNAPIGGADPTVLIRQYPGRAVTVHVKDDLPGRPDPVLGSSDFDWKQFLRTCQSQGATEWYIIEHDRPSPRRSQGLFDSFARIPGRYRLVSAISVEGTHFDGLLVPCAGCSQECPGRTRFAPQEEREVFGLRLVIPVLTLLAWFLR